MPTSAGSKILNVLVWLSVFNLGPQGPFSIAFIMKTFSYSAKYFISIALALLFSCTRTAPEKHLAEVGKLYITVNEYKAAFEFNPYLEKVPTLSEAKKYLLSAMIAEKIFAQEVKAVPADVQQMIRQHWREAMIEAFWQEEILNKISVSKKELRQAYKNSKRKIIVQYLVFNSPEAAIQQQKRLNRGIDFVRLAELNGFYPSAIPVDTILFCGKIPNIQKEAFRLKEGQVSSLIKEGNRYFLLRKIDEIKNVFRSEDDFKRSATHLKKLIKSRAGQQAFKTYFKTQLKSRGYQVNGAAFRKMVGLAEKRLFSEGLDTPGREKSFGKFLEEKNKNVGETGFDVVSFAKHGVWTAKKLLQRIGLASYPVDLTTKGAFRQSMIFAAKHVLDDQIIINEAKRLSLDKSAYVHEQSRIWEGHLKALTGIRDILRAKKTSANDADQIQKWLLGKQEQYPVKIDYSMLDSLQLVRTNVFALKQQFPGRSAVPLIQPLPKMPKWKKTLFK